MQNIQQLQTRKLNIIEQLIIINDDEVFNKVETILNETLNDKNLKKLTKQQLLKRAKISNENIAKGEFISQDDLEKQAQNW